MISRLPLAISAVAISTFWISGQATAAVDNFDYAAGPLAGNAGGSASGGVDFTSSYARVEGAVNVITDAGSIGTASGVPASAPYVQAGSGYSQDTAREITPQSNTVSYVSGLIAIGSGADASLGDSFGGFGAFEGGTEKFLIGQRFGAANFGVASNGSGGTDGDSAAPISNLEAAYLVAKIDQVANTLTLYVNPDLTLLEANATADFVLNYNASFDDDFDTIRLRGGSSDGSFRFDNLSVENTSPFAAVPEPATFVMLGCGIALAGLRRRSHA